MGRQKGRGREVEWDGKQTVTEEATHNRFMLSYCIWWRGRGRVRKFISCCGFVKLYSLTLGLEATTQKWGKCVIKFCSTKRKYSNIHQQIASSHANNQFMIFHYSFSFHTLLSRVKWTRVIFRKEIVNFCGQETRAKQCLMDCLGVV